MAATIRSWLYFASALAVASPLSAQTAAATDRQSCSPGFAVVSIRPHKPTGNNSHWATPTPNGYAAQNYEVAGLILNAYDLKSPNQIIGLPKWASEDSFDIEARIDDVDLPTYRELSERERKERAAPMLRAMLMERFGLRIHQEARTLPVYSLIVAKGGFKLKQSQAPISLYGMGLNRGSISVRGGPIGARFIAGLSMETGRIVVDKTGLTGWYDIILKWMPDEDRAAGASGPTLFTALEEQLGLKLVSDNAPVDVIIVDHVERPSPN